MVTQEHLSLRQAADALELQPMRLYRLGHHLRLAPGDPCLPRTLIVQAQAEADKETRYRLVLDWLLAEVRGNQTAQR